MVKTNLWNKSVVFGLLGASVMAYSAIVPGFTGAHADFEPKTANLLVDFEEAGLEAGSQIDIKASAHVVAIYASPTEGGADVQVETDLKVGVPYHVTSDGTVHGTLPLEPPAAAGKLISITYTNVELEDTTNGLPTDVIDNVSRNSMTGFLARHHSRSGHLRRTARRKSLSSS